MAMNTTSALPHTPVQGIAAAQAQRREQLLSLFDKSGLSGSAFAKQHQIPYSTLCQWRQRRAQRSKKITFTQVQGLPTRSCRVGRELMKDPTGFFLRRFPGRLRWG